MNQEQKEIKAWREVKKGKKFFNALRGLHVFLKTTRNLYFHIFAAILAILLGFGFRISEGEWLAVIFAIGFVIVSEAFNTAIEIDIDLTSPEYHTFARDIKDVAAAAVLLSALTALAVGLVVFLPKFLYTLISYDLFL